MLHDLGAFYPVRPGTDNTLYSALRGTLRLANLSSAYLTHELAVATLTPDWEPLDWAVILKWGRNFQPILAQVHAAYLDAGIDLTPQITANTLSITIDDGLDWLRVILRRRHGRYYGRVPVWTRRALRETRFNHNFTNRDLQHWLGAKSLIAVSMWVGDKR